jgi:hypothetical protein
MIFFPPPTIPIYSGGGGGIFQYIDPCVQGKVTPLREGTAASSVSVDRSCMWSLGQVPAPRSRDWLFGLGSGAVQVRRLSSDDQADMVRVCSHQLSAAPVTGTVLYTSYHSTINLFPGVPLTGASIPFM